MTTELEDFKEQLHDVDNRIANLEDMREEILKRIDNLESSLE